MLQQTQVKTVLPYFAKFLKRYPTLKSLSQAKERTVLKLWEGLGYYRRAKNLLKSSKQLAEIDFKLPDSLEEIKKLPGVGNYTANALLALIHDKPTLAVDGNVKRVFSRILNTEEKEINFEKLTKINKKKIFIKNRNSDVVEAFMEFGAMICKPKNPECSNCKVKKKCNYFKSKKDKKINFKRHVKNKKINVFCYLNRKKQIGLTKNSNVGFLKTFVLPEIKTRQKTLDKDWNLLLNYNQNISNKKFNINLYYKFAKKIPRDFKWYKVDNRNEIIPTFTKKILSEIKKIM